MDCIDVATNTNITFQRRLDRVLEMYWKGIPLRDALKQERVEAKELLNEISRSD